MNADFMPLSLTRGTLLFFLPFGPGFWQANSGLWAVGC